VVPVEFRALFRLPLATACTGFAIGQALRFGQSQSHFRQKREGAKISKIGFTIRQKLAA
jgi:hypothetical protein